MEEIEKSQELPEANGSTILKCLAIDDESLALDLLEDNIQKIPFLKLEKRKLVSMLDYRLKVTAKLPCL